MGEWLGVTEFADLVGKTPQAVYKRFNSLDPDLTKVENGKKLVNTEAAPLFREAETDALVKRISSLTHDVEILKSENAALLKEVEELRENRKTLIERIEYFEAHTSALNDRIREMNVIQVNTQSMLQTALSTSQSSHKRLSFKERVKQWWRGSDSLQEVE